MTETLSRESSVEADMRRIFGTTQRRRPPPITLAAAAPAREVAANIPNRARFLWIAAPIIVLLAMGTTIGLIVTHVSNQGAGRPEALPPAIKSVAKLPVIQAVPPPIASPVSLPVDQVQSDTDRAVSTVGNRPKRATRVASGRRAEAPELDIAPAPAIQASGTACWNNPAECPDQAVVQADQRLARAYQRARQAGVPNNEMRAARARWDQARDLADDPPAMIAAYDRLADDLDDTRARIGRGE